MKEAIAVNKPLDLIRLMRPSQWIKNGFVYIGILFGKEYGDFDLLLKVIMAAIAFSLVSSCIYIINDLADKENDQRHPKKKNRPIPSGKVTTTAAINQSVILALFGFTFAYLSSPKVAAIVALYALINLLYSYRLKEIVILDVFCISAGFMLRIFAGTVGVGIAPSRWLLFCGLMITLFLGFAKRRAEIKANGGNSDQRKVLSDYGIPFLDEIIVICATGAIIAYSLYTMNERTVLIHGTENLIYTIPFVIYAIFRYIYLIQHHDIGEDPSIDLFKDPHILFSVIGWGVATIILI